jgi:hypothetical protein
MYVTKMNYVFSVYINVLDVWCGPHSCLYDSYNLYAVTWIMYKGSYPKNDIYHNIYGCVYMD